MSKQIVITGIFLIALSIILGAVAAHALEKIVSEELILTFEKGVKYQLYGGFGLLIVGLNHTKFNFSLRWFLLLTVIGVILFSGCIYLYVLHEVAPALKNAVLIVPVGGLCMIAAWVLLGIQTFRKN